MTFDAHANLASGVVSVAPTTPTAGLTMTVVPDAGVTVPAAPFTAVVAPTGTPPSHANAEIVRVSVNASGVWTMTRTAEGSTNRAIAVGDVVYIGGVTAKTLTDIESAVTAETSRATTAESLLAKGLIPVALKTAGYSPNVNEFVPVDATSGVVTITLPSAPADKTRIGVKKIDSSANLVTLARGGSDVFNKAGGSTSVSLTYANQGVQLQYEAATGIWYIVASDIGLTALDSRYTSKGYAADVPDASGLYPPQVTVQPWVAASDLVSQFEAGHGWTGSTGFVANDTADYITGTQSSKITTSSTGTFKMQSPTLALDLTAKQIRVRVKIDDITNVNSMNVWAGNDSTITNGYKWFVEGTLGGSNQLISGGTTAQQGWVVLVLNVADAQLIGSPTRTGIVCLKLEISRTAAAGEVTLHIDEIDLIPEPVALYPNGAAVICFDDIPDTQWTNGKPALDLYRMRANLFAITDQVGQAGRLTLDQLRVFQDEGHEIHAHAYTDADHALTYTGMTAAALEADLRAQKAWMRAQGFRGEGTAYPKGQYGVTTDSVPTHSIARKYFSFARADSSGTNKPGGTYPIGDPYRLPALSSITSFAGGFSPSTLTGTGVGSLTAVAASHGVKIMVFHKIVAGAAAGLDEISLADFQSILAQINSLGMKVITLGELMAASASTAGGAPSGAAGGDLAGTYPNPTVKGSVALSGTPTAPTAAVDTNTVQIATTAMVLAQAAAAAPLVDGKLSVVGSATRFARADHVHRRWSAEPSDRNWKGWTIDPEAAASSSVLATSGTLYVFRALALAGDSIANVITQLTTLGATLTTGQCFLGLGDPATGARLATSADLAATWAAPGTTGVKTIAMLSAGTVPASGEIEIWALFNGTTGPTFPRANGNALINTGFTAPKYATADTGISSLPATRAALSALSVSFCFGLS